MIIISAYTLCITIHPMPGGIEMSLITVAEAILDEAAEEHRDQNLANKESVARYADSIDIQLSDYHADAVLTVCKLWIENTEEDHWNGTDDYYEYVTTPLEYLERATELDEIVKGEVQSEEDLRALCSAVNEIMVIQHYFSDHGLCEDELTPFNPYYSFDSKLPNLPLDNRCRGAFSTDEIWSWAVPDPAYDNAPKFVMMDGSDKEHPFVVVEFADDEYLHDCWGVTIEEEA
jgi:hypothetical protein